MLPLLSSGGFFSPPSPFSAFVFPPALDGLALEPICALVSPLLTFAHPLIVLFPTLLLFVTLSRRRLRLSPLSHRLHGVIRKELPTNFPL